MLQQTPHSIFLHKLENTSLVFLLKFLSFISLSLKLYCITFSLLHYESEGVLENCSIKLNMYLSFSSKEGERSKFKCIYIRIIHAYALQVISFIVNSIKTADRTDDNLNA